MQIRGDSKPVQQYQYSLAFMLRDPGTVRPRTWEMLEVLKSLHMNLKPIFTFTLFTIFYCIYVVLFDSILLRQLFNYFRIPSNIVLVPSHQLH